MEFLNVSTDVDLKMDTKSNPATVPRIKGVRNLLYKPSFMSKIGKFIVQNSEARQYIKNLIDNINEKDNPSRLSVEVQHRIINTYYLEEIKKLEKLIGRDLSVWLP